MKLNLLIAAATCFAATQSAIAQWQLTGNAGTNPATNFIGTTDNQSFRIRTNNVVRMAITNDGKLGVGTASPSYVLDVKADSNCTVRLQSKVFGSSNMVIDRFDNTFNCLVNYKTNGADNWKTGCAANDNFTIRNAASADILTINASTNNVGIGTITPSEKLQVIGNINSSGNISAAGIVSATGGNSTNWNTAFGWGNHAAAGYLTSFTEVDPQVGANTTGFIPRWDGAALVTGSAFDNGAGKIGIGTALPSTELSVGANKFNVAALDGDVTFSDVNGSVTFPATGGANSPMIQMFASGTTNADRMVISHSASFSNYGLQYQDASDKFNFLSNGVSVLTADLTNKRIGIGTSSPLFPLDVESSTELRCGYFYNTTNSASTTFGIYAGAFGAGSGDKRGGSFDCIGGTGNNFALRGIASGGATTYGIYTSATGGTTNYAAYFEAGNVLIKGNTAISATTLPSVYKLDVQSDNTSTSAAINGKVNYVGTVDVRAIEGYSKTADGYGYGLFATGGYRGVYGLADAGAYAGFGYGVTGIASGTAGTRIGVYGQASGGTTANWGGYFAGSTYTDFLNVGTQTGATGYKVSVYGKIICEEMKVQLKPNWPDFVFNKDYKLPALSEVKASIEKNKHLPGIPTSAEIAKNEGFEVGDMQVKLLQKVEELTLYVIEQNEEIQKLKKDNQQLHTTIDTLKK